MKVYNASYNLVPKLMSLKKINELSIKKCFLLFFIFNYLASTPSSDWKSTGMQK